MLSDQLLIHNTPLWKYSFIDNRYLSYLLDKNKNNNVIKLPVIIKVVQSSRIK